MIEVSNLAPDITSCKPVFRLKGGLFPLTVLELNVLDLDRLRVDLQSKVNEAPGFFQQVPTVLGLEDIDAETGDIDLAAIRDLCREFGLIVVALRGAEMSLQLEAIALDLAILPAVRNRKTAPLDARPQQVIEDVLIIDDIDTSIIDNTELPSPENNATEDNASENTTAKSTAHAAGTKIITTPVRSGQQIYAAGDLVVLAPVSAGAEILADGNIHVYGPARGRILAGVKGNRKARVFCQTLEAELVSIAGYFKINEDLRDKHWKQSVQFFLTDETLNSEKLD